MGPLLAFSRGVDKLNAAVGYLANWAVFLSCAISAGNAFIRYGLSYSSNAWLEVQWYLFGATVMLGASYTLFKNEHVRVDILYASVSVRTRLWIDVLGFIFFLLPATILLAWMTWPFFLDSFIRNEGSPNAGGLLRWPVKILMPIGFFLLTLQGLSELIKRVALLRGLQPDAEVVVEYHRPEQ
ncbi:TRAP transporter small permease subunit [Paracraurococcus ruber]|uniref:TRAP transporter small permease protein n=1 Tax=Paracraurococcus ruber TaxID=77675 RepID=A0ABS1CUT9_9PROT|nr:TRAP transporter small permease subunit [Paracraurococcus ruber]MBK1658113.1 sugar transporter [Paracraurococcus ruber]TDG29138.1 TRAP transporter small permease subunit [Paracraurococcus ruber]